MKWLMIKRWLPVILWAGLMIFLSRQSGTDTTELSGLLTRMLAEVLARLGIIVDQVQLHHALRTSAHIIVYFVWSVLLYRAFCGCSRVCFTVSALLRSFLLTLVLCSAVAVLDELQKKWIPGRHCNWNEVVLNAVSALVGTLICSVIHGFSIKHHKTKRI